MDELDEEEEVAKEMYGGVIPRVDAVRGPASGMRFVVLKAGEAQDPEAIAAVQKAEKSTADINDLPDSDFAYIEPGGKKDEDGKTIPRSLRHFPIMDAAHVRNALSRAPQSPFGSKAMSKIQSAAKKFGIDTKEASVTKSNEAAEAVDPEELVIKADEDSTGNDLDPTEVLAEPAEEAPGDPNEPGSPAWESIDAATARKWTSILSRAKNAITVMGDREFQEVATGAGGDDDVDSAWDLQNACDAVDFAISVLAPFAVDEQSEADCGTESLEGVSKAMEAANVEDIDTLEGFAPVLKAGRTLSAANEQTIRSAVDSLQKVLASLPPAPDVVTKSQESEVSDEAPEEPVVKKDDPDPMVACYDANGNLLGAVAQQDLTPLSSGTPVDKAPAEPADAPPEDPDAEAPAVAPDAATAPAADPNAPAAPAAPVAKADGDQPDLEEVEKSTDVAALKAELEGYQTVFKSLEERLAVVENTPMPGGPRLSGMASGGLTPTSDGNLALRGQENGQTPELVRVAKALDEETDPVKQAQLSRQLTAMKLAMAYGGAQ